MNELKKIDWSIEKSKDNNDILKINGLLIHSKFFPQKEASDFIFNDKNLILIFGIGLGYHINNIIKNNPHSIFIIFEPYHEILKLSRRYIEDVFEENKDKICILDALDSRVVYEFLDKKSFITEHRLQIYSNLGYKKLLPEFEASFLKVVKTTIGIHTQNTFTESNFIPLWTKNFLYNMTNLDNLPLINPTRKKLKNNIAVIACAGPTLLYDLEIIKTYRDKITIFTVDTALKTLLRYGINPDFIVTLDAQYYTMYDYDKKISDETAVLMDAISTPEIVRIHKNIFFTVTGNIFLNNIIEYFFNFFKINFFGISTGGNVSDYAASLAMNFGFDKLYFAGLDLSYPLMQSHCIETPYYSRLVRNNNYYETVETNLIKSLINRNAKKVPSRVKGNEIYTDFILKNYADYFSKLSQNFNNIDLFYSKFDGLNLEGFITVDLLSMISKNETKRFLWNELIEQKSVINIEKDKLIKFYNDLLNNIYKRALIFDELFKKTSFETDGAERLNEWKKVVYEIFADFPFLRKFVLMTEIILQKKQVSEDSIIWFKHIGHKILQSIYYIIRILQKVLNRK